jgi:hypothetical protein
MKRVVVGRPFVVGSRDRPAARATPALLESVVVARTLLAIRIVEARVARRVAEVAMSAGIAARTRDLGAPGVAGGACGTERLAQAVAEVVHLAG